MENKLDSRPSKAQESVGREVCNQILQAVEGIVEDALEGSDVKMTSDACFRIIHLNLNKSVFSETSQYLVIHQPISENPENHRWTLDLAYSSAEPGNKHEKVVTLWKDDLVHLYNNRYEFGNPRRSIEVGLDDESHPLVEVCATIRPNQDSGHNVLTSEQDLQAILTDLRSFLN